MEQRSEITEQTMESCSQPLLNSPVDLVFPINMESYISYVEGSRLNFVTILN